MYNNFILYLKFNKKFRFLIYIYLGLLLSLFLGMQYLQNSTNSYLIERFGSWKLLYVETALFFSILLSISAGIWNLLRHEIRQKRVFFCVFFAFVFMFIYAAFLTHGESFRTIFVPDKKDTFMDFYNSIQYGFEPYSNKVIYPPLINLILALLGKLVLIHGIEDHAYYIRDSQMGHIVFLLWSFFMLISICIVFWKLQKSNCIQKTLLCFLIFMSVPFLFLLERGNLLILTILLIGVFLLTYLDGRRWVRWIAYLALGGAAGIKIVPALLGILIIRERQWHDIGAAFFAGVAIFFLPFHFLDGGPFDLLENIRYTTSLMKGVAVDKWMTWIVGNGCYVNFSNTIVFLGRLWNFDGTFWGEIVLRIILLGGIFLSCYVRKAPQWKVITLLSALMVICPGFSPVYNLTYMIFPLIFFLNQERFERLDSLYLILFLGMFIPVVNFKMPFFSYSIYDIYPARITTALESISLLCITLVMETEFAFLAFRQARASGHRVQGTVAIIIAGITLCSIWPVFKNPSVEAAHPMRYGLYRASTGISTINGFYSHIHNGATLRLNADNLCKDGLLVRLNSVGNENGDQIHLFMNEYEVVQEELAGKKDICLFVEPSVISKISTGGPIECRVEWDSERVTEFGLVYIGPGCLLPKVDANMYMDQASYGFFHYHRQHALWMGNDASFYMDSNSLKDGLYLDYVVPAELLQGLNGEKIVLNIAVNGKRIKSLPIEKIGHMKVAIPMSELDIAGGDISKKAIKVCLAVNKSFSDMALGTNGNTTSRSLIINYIGDISRYLFDISNTTDTLISSLPTQGCENGIGLNQWKEFLVTKDYVENGLTIVYKMPAIYQILPGNEEDELELWLDGICVWRKKIELKETPRLGAMHVPKIIFKGLPSIVNAEIRLRSNNQRLLNAETIEKFSGEKVALRYVGKAFLEDRFVAITGKEIFWQSDGLSWRPHKKMWEMGWNAQVLLAANERKMDTFLLRYRVPKELFLANPNKTPHLSIYLDGDMLCDAKLVAGENCLALPLPERYIDSTITAEPMLFELKSDTVYNLAKEKILLEYDDKSIEIESIGLVSSRSDSDNERQ